LFASVPYISKYIGQIIGRIVIIIIIIIIIIVLITQFIRCHNMAMWDKGRAMSIKIVNKWAYMY